MRVSIAKRLEFDDLAKQVRDLAELVRDQAITKDKAQKLIREAVAKSRRVIEFPQTGTDWVGVRVEDDIAELNDMLFIAKSLLGKGYEQQRVVKKMLDLGLTQVNLVKKLEKAMAAGTSGAGMEWVPTGFSQQLFERIRLELKVAALHQRIPMPTNPYKAPVAGADATAYLVGESTSDTADKIKASTPGTVDLTFTAKKLAARVLTSDELTEDSIVPVLPFIRNSLTRALAEAQETATINGDTADTHMDSDVTATDDARKAWDGYRKLAQNAAKIDIGGSWNVTGLRSLRKAMGKYGVNPGNLAWIVSIAAYNGMLGFAEFLTTDKYGPHATLLTGELGRVDNIPVIVSEFVRQDLNASGVYDGTTTDKTIVILANRAGFAYGDRRQVSLRTREDIETEQQIVTGSQRVDFEPVFDPTAHTLVAIGYNVPT